MAITMERTAAAMWRCGALQRARSFAAATSYSVGKAPAGLTLADVNGDGKPDLAASSQSQSITSVFLNSTL